MGDHCFSLANCLDQLRAISGSFLGDTPRNAVRNNKGVDLAHGSITRCSRSWFSNTLGVMGQWIQVDSSRSRKRGVICKPAIWSFPHYPCFMKTEPYWIRYVCRVKSYYVAVLCWVEQQLFDLEKFQLVANLFSSLYNESWSAKLRKTSYVRKSPSKLTKLFFLEKSNVCNKFSWAQRWLQPRKRRILHRFCTR